MSDAHHLRIKTTIRAYTARSPVTLFAPPQTNTYTQIPSHLLLALLVQNAELLGFEPQVKSASKNDRAEDADHDEHLS